MTDFVLLQPYLRRWGRRLRLAESLSWGPWGAAAGLGLSLLLALSARLWPILMSRQLIVLAASFVCLGMLTGLAIAWLRPRTPLSLARVFDRRFALAERLTTAAEIGTGRLQATPVMTQAQVGDTLDAARRVDARTLLPLRVPAWALRAIVLMAAVLALLAWLPNQQEGILLQQAAVQAAIEEQIEELEAVKEQVAQAEGLTEEEREALLQALEEAIAGLEEGQAMPEEAIAALSEAEQALAGLQDPGVTGLEESLERAGESLAESELTEDIARALAEGDYQAAAEALAESADTLGEEGSREEALELAEQLAEAADALAESDPELAEKLAEAAEAIENGDIAQAQEAIEAASQELGEAGERVERQEAVENALSELQEGRQEIAQAAQECPT